MDVDNNDENEITTTQARNRYNNKNAEYIQNMDEQSRNHIKQMKLCILEEDNIGYKEDIKDADSDYDVDNSNSEEEKTKRKKLREKKKTAAETIHFGKINLIKYFVFEKDTISNAFPNYNNILVKQTNHSKFKICTICFNLADYTCPKCLDKYCSRHCYKLHIESKCVKYLDL